MYTIPHTFAQKLALSVQYSQSEVRFTANAAFAKLARIRAERNLQYAIANDFPDDYIARAQEDCEEARYLEWEYENYDEDSGICCWNSGYQFDDNGNEVWATVDFNPLSFDFIAIRHNERGSYEIGTAKTFEEAEKIVSRALYGDDVDEEVRPAPSISMEVSDLAGAVVVTYGGKTTSVKSIVDEILVRANQGSGLHYEIFAKRAASMLNGLPSQLAGADRESVEKYLEYDRY